MQMTYNGASLTGTPEEMREFLSVDSEKSVVELEEPLISSNGFSDEQYKSESRGWLRIGDMHTLHITNAILKMRRERETNSRCEEFEDLVQELSARAYAGMRGEIRE